MGFFIIIFNYLIDRLGENNMVISLLSGIFNYVYISEIIQTLVHLTVKKQYMQTIYLF